jgi:hypothetical protein
MKPDKERKVAVYLAGILLVVGAISYAAFPEKTPAEPVRIMFETVSGNVLFDHKTHGSDEGYGVSCTDCHHHNQEEEADFLACGACHQIPEDGETVPKACLDCHDLSEVEDTEIIKRSDAFHSQCIGCHEEFGEGPGKGSEACASCHVL